MTRSMPIAHVFAVARIQAQVLDPVIRPVPVDVVDNLGAQQRTMKVPLHDRAVFEDVSLRVERFGEGVRVAQNAYVATTGQVPSTLPPRRVFARATLPRRLAKFWRHHVSRRSFSRCGVPKSGSASKFAKAGIRADHTPAWTWTATHVNAADLTRQRRDRWRTSSHMFSTAGMTAKLALTAKKRRGADETVARWCHHVTCITCLSATREAT